MEYPHTQIGKTVFFVLLWGLVVILITALASEEGSSATMGVALITVVIAVVTVVFTRLTVTVDPDVVRASFGWGWPKRSLPIGDIAAFGPVRNKWYLGWGVRKVPGGWMYNVWGLEAVEVVMRSGTRFRIDTDNGPDLVAALSAHTGLSPSGNA